VFCCVVLCVVYCVCCVRGYIGVSCQVVISPYHRKITSQGLIGSALSELALLLAFLSVPWAFLMGKVIFQEKQTEETSVQVFACI